MLCSSFLLILLKKPQTPSNKPGTMKIKAPTLTSALDNSAMDQSVGSAFPK